MSSELHHGGVYAWLTTYALTTGVITDKAVATEVALCFSSKHLALFGGVKNILSYFPQADSQIQALAEFL